MIGKWFSLWKKRIILTLSFQSENHCKYYFLHASQKTWNCLLWNMSSRSLGEYIIALLIWCDYFRRGWTCKVAELIIMFSTVLAASSHWILYPAFEPTIFSFIPYAVRYFALFTKHGIWKKKINVVFNVWCVFGQCDPYCHRVWYHRTKRLVQRITWQNRKQDDLVFRQFCIVFKKDSSCPYLRLDIRLQILTWANFQNHC